MMEGLGAGLEWERESAPLWEGVGERGTCRQRKPSSRAPGLQGGADPLQAPTGPEAELEARGCGGDGAGPASN